MIHQKIWEDLKQELEKTIEALRWLEPTERSRIQLETYEAVLKWMIKREKK